jgi:DNA damage-binding protein 1
MVEVSAFTSTFIAQHLHVTPSTKVHSEERLVVGDGMRSVFALEVDEASGAIIADQRDMATHQVTALHGIQDVGQGVIIADVSLNLKRC